MIAATLTVDLAQRSYPVYIGQSIFLDKMLWNKYVAGSQVCIVTNATIASLYLTQFCAIFSEFACSTVLLPDGEVHKQLDTWRQIIDTLVAKQHKRSTTLIALGGGVVGDITGFAAACYQRGVNFIQVPTTLLAQVDASLGGKTGVNYQNQKNLIGTFYQPKAVIIDTAFLSTLPEREFRAGLAEVIKYALIHDKTFFRYLSQHMSEILARSPQALAYIIKICCRIKVHFIEQDEYDANGLRALLNFGHTFGHALEHVTDYLSVLHGEAVAWGMRKACQLSQRLGYLSLEAVTEVEKLLEQCDLLIQLPSEVAADQLLTAMYHDKKNATQRIRLILLKQLGEAFVTDAVAPEVIAEVLAHRPLE